ncbi:MAG TPA: hypothetical protein VJA18_06360 [Candidatus Nanoarchaeia archaeon]|nr:hypothetical protein [Candidatus Nanoarchaeia archaeon]
MTQDDYELLPQQVIADLKYEVEALKKKLTQPDTKANELILEIESMKDAVHELNLVFEKALQQMKDEDVTKTFQSLLEKLDTVVSQNETIAKGMIAISDRLDDFMNKQSGRSAPNMPVQHTMGPPSMPGRVAPRPEAAQMSMPADFPPPPGPNGRKPRVGLFS